VFRIRVLMMMVFSVCWKLTAANKSENKLTKLKNNSSNTKTAPFWEITPKIT
jgi:uncharacterized metal-binding protein